MRIDFEPFPQCAPVAVPVDAMLFALSLARQPRNWTRPFIDIDPPLDLTHLLFFVETPCVEREECDAWVAGNYDKICAGVRRWMLTPPNLN